MASGYEESFVATSGQTNFTLDYAPSTAWVWVAGLAQDASTWSISGLDIILSTGAEENDVVDVYYVRAKKISELDTATGMTNADFIPVVQEGTSKKITYANFNNVIDNINYSGYKAIALSCDNGTTVPENPTIGQWFLHTPTGRSILMQYNGSSWTSIISFGTMTLYVDNTDGTDDVVHGTGVDANAFKTIQYAIDIIPPVYGGSVSIVINNETYSEDIIIRGKRPNGNYDINIFGTLNIHDNLVATGTGQKGATTTLPTFVANTPLVDHHYNQQILKFTSGSNDGQYRIIEHNDTTTITLVGNTLIAAPVSGDTATVYDWGTTISSITVASNQVGINIWECSIGNVFCQNFSNVSLFRCKTTSSSVANIYASDYSRIYADHCAILGTYSNGSWAVNNSSLQIISTLIYGWTTWGIYAEYVGYIYFGYGSVIDGIIKNANAIAIYTTFGSSAKFWCPDVYNVIKNSGKGLYAVNESFCGQTEYNSYTNNTANETAVSASYGYID